MAARVSALRQTFDRANCAIRALNWMHAGSSSKHEQSEQWASPASVGTHSQRVQAIHTYIIRCSQQYNKTSPPKSAAATPTVLHNIPKDSYDEAVKVAAVPIEAKLLSLPSQGGTFPARRYLGDDLLAFLDARPDAMLSPLVGDIAAELARSYQSAEYVATLARLYQADMCAFSAEAAKDVVGLFAQWKEVPSAHCEGSQRFLVDGRRPNCRFLTPDYEHTSGEDLTRQEVEEGMVLEMARADAADFFHTFRTAEELQRFFGLRPVRAVALEAYGIVIPPEQIDESGMTHGRLSTLPMGFKAAPSIAQGAHECVVYGAEGSGSPDAKALPPALDPAARLSSRRQPEVGTAAAREPHALVIDDVLCFRQIPMGMKRSTAEAKRQAQHVCSERKRMSSFHRVLQRYDEVNIRTKPSKVHDYSPTQVGLGHLLDHNEFRTTQENYDAICGGVQAVCRRGWAKPREVEGLVGSLTSRMLLERWTLSCF